MSAKGKEASSKAHIIWIISTLTILIIAFAAFASITIYIDPFFHYHGPLENYQYPLSSESYQNDGIARNFDYDSIITGNSMVENFKTSEAADLFGGNFIKLPLSGGYYKEINDTLQRAYDAGKHIKCVIRCIDYNSLIKDKDSCKEDFDYPTYLYNNNPFDDINYVLNKSVFFTRTLEVIQYTEEGGQTSSFDDYANWNGAYPFGADAILVYTLGEKARTPQILSEEERTMISENIRQNVTDLADAHPETTFYLFFPPYSICYWDVLNNDGQIDWRIDAEQLAIEELLKHPNIRLYSFCNDFETVCNLDNYIDQIHYGEWINSKILTCMHEDEYLLTKDNYTEYLETVRDFYTSYNYSRLRN